MGLTISGTRTVGVHLTSASQNPVSVTSTGAIVTAGSYAIYGSAGVNWAITNDGALAGANYGITLAGGGSITNGSAKDTTASISSSGQGVVIAGGIGLVTNYGAITGDVRLGTGGTVANHGLIIGQVGLAGGAVINGANIDTDASISAGVFFSGGKGTVANYGSISVSTGDSVNLNAGGAVTNGSASDRTALIFGGIGISGGAGNLTNYGTVQGFSLFGGNDAVFFGAGGTVTNGSITDTSASIDGSYYGVQGATKIVNYGVISGGSYPFGSSSEAAVSLGSGTLINGSSADTKALISSFNQRSVDLVGGIVMNFGTLVGALSLRGGSVINGSNNDIVAAINGNAAAMYGAIYGYGTITNFGTTSEQLGLGVAVRLYSTLVAGTVINTVSGDITGRAVGVLGYTGSATVTNAGRITGPAGDGVSLAGGGLLTNRAGGLITGGIGVGATGVAPTIMNRGSIGGTGNGIYLGAGGNVTNAAGAHITGTHKNGISLKSPGSVSNSGTISATAGVFLAAGGGVTNTRHGLISGSADGVLVGGGNVTVTTAGTISGPTYAIDFKGGGNDTLIVDPGAVFAGTVNGGSATSALVLASAASVGGIAGLGTSFAGFAMVTEAAHARWAVTGPNSLASTTMLTVNGALTDAGSLTAAGAATVAGTLATTGTGKVQLGDGLTLQSRSVLLTASAGSIEIGTAGGAAVGVVTVDKGALLSGAGTIKNSVVDNGGIQASGGRLTVTGGVTGTGAVSISSRAVLTVDGKMAAVGLTFLSGGHETAVFATPTAVTSTLAGFAASDTIDLGGFVATKLSFAGHTLTVDGKGGGVAHLTFGGAYMTKDFAFTPDHHGGTNITFV